MPPAQRGQRLAGVQTAREQEQESARVQLQAAGAVVVQVEPALALALELELELGRVSAQLVPVPPVVVQGSWRAAWVVAQVSSCDCPTR